MSLELVTLQLHWQLVPPMPLPSMLVELLLQPLVLPPPATYAKPEQVPLVLVLAPIRLMVLPT